MPPRLEVVAVGDLPRRELTDKRADSRGVGRGNPSSRLWTFDVRRDARAAVSAT
jgi:hypothetical protein